MKIILYIILSIVGLCVLFVAGIFIYLKYFESSPEAVSKLVPQGIYDDQVVNYLSEYAKELRGGTALALAYVRGDEFQYYGVKRSSDTLHAVYNENLVFEIGSITKVMTAYVIHHLADEDKLQLDHSILDYLPVNNDQLHDITIKSLLSHTSGLPRMPDNMNIGLSNGEDPYKSYGKEELYAYLKSASISVEAKGKDEYSNLAYGVLGAIAEEVTGQQMADLYDQMIFDPLNMSHSSFHLDDVRDIASPGVMPFGAESSYWNWDILRSAGAVKSSAKQMAYFSSISCNKAPKH